MPEDLRAKIVLTRSQLHHQLGLADDVSIYGFYSVLDPPALVVMLHAERFARPIEPEDWNDFADAESRIVRLEEAQ